MDVYIILYKSKGSSLSTLKEPAVYTTKDYKEALNQAVDLTSNPDSTMYSITELDYYNPYSDGRPGVRRMDLHIVNGNFKLLYRDEIEQAKE